MNISNLTKNQHWLSQAEQRLNSINPLARPDKQRIYSFVVSDRETPTVRLESARGHKIQRSLACTDLFSLDVAGDERANLEGLFERYEQNVTEHSRCLIQKASERNFANLKAPLLNVFVSKFLNFLRNPYCVEKVLNTFGSAANFHLTDPSHRATLDALIRGNKPQQASICARFGFSAETYTRWLGALCMMLPAVAPGEPSLLELTLKGLFESHYVVVQLFTYSSQIGENSCLLSDRGFTIRAEKDHTFVIDFNLCSTAFVSFAFCDASKYAPPGASPELLAAVLPRLRAQVVVRHVEDDFVALKKYNTCTAYQCAKRVYSSRTAPVL